MKWSKAVLVFTEVAQLSSCKIIKWSHNRDFRKFFDDCDLQIFLYSMSRCCCFCCHSKTSMTSLLRLHTRTDQIEKYFIVEKINPVWIQIAAETFVPKNRINSKPGAKSSLTDHCVSEDVYSCDCEYVRLCVCAYVCVGERERKRENEGLVSVSKWVRGRKKEGEIEERRCLWE